VPAHLAGAVRAVDQVAVRAEVLAARREVAVRQARVRVAALV
jgi:hypothetical protein